MGDGEEGDGEEGGRRVMGKRKQVVERRGGGEEGDGEEGRESNVIQTYWCTERTNVFN